MRKSLKRETTIEIDKFSKKLYLISSAFILARDFKGTVLCCIGLEAVYTDPQTRLNYSNAEEFQEIRRLPSDIVQGISRGVVVSVYINTVKTTFIFRFLFLTSFFWPITS